MTACQVLHSQHVPWPYGTKALRWVGCGFPWCRTPKPLPRAIPGRKILAELRISFGEKTGIFLLHFSWWDHFISLQSGIVDSWATSGKGRNPFHIYDYIYIYIFTYIVKPQQKYIYMYAYIYIYIYICACFFIF